MSATRRFALVVRGGAGLHASVSAVTAKPVRVGGRRKVQKVVSKSLGMTTKGSATLRVTLSKGLYAVLRKSGRLQTTVTIKITDPSTGLSASATASLKLLKPKPARRR